MFWVCVSFTREKAYDRKYLIYSTSAHKFGVFLISFYSC